MSLNSLLGQKSTSLVDILKQQQEMNIESTRAFGSNALKAFNVTLFVLQHINKFPEDCALLGTIICKDKVTSSYIIESMSLGEEISTAYRIKRRAREWQIKRYNMLMKAIIAFAYEHPTEIILGMYYGKRKNSKKYQSTQDHEPEESIIESAIS